MNELRALLRALGVTPSGPSAARSIERGISTDTIIAPAKMQLGP